MSEYENLQFRVKGPDEEAMAELTVSRGETVVDIERYRGPVELENRMTRW